MPRKGYWIECMPLWEEANENAMPDMYRASLPALPELVENAPSASQAIDRLRKRLKELRCKKRKSGQILPKLENPVRPPKRSADIRGWMSVYVELS